MPSLLAAGPAGATGELRRHRGRHGRPPRRAATGSGGPSGRLRHGAGRFGLRRRQRRLRPGVLHRPTRSAPTAPESDLEPVFAAVLEAVEEALLNSLFMARTTVGVKGRVKLRGAARPDARPVAGTPGRAAGPAGGRRRDARRVRGRGPRTRCARSPSRPGQSPPSCRAGVARPSSVGWPAVTPSARRSSTPLVEVQFDQVVDDLAGRRVAGPASASPSSRVTTAVRDGSGRAPARRRGRRRWRPTRRRPPSAAMPRNRPAPVVEQRSDPLPGPLCGGPVGQVEQAGGDQVVAVGGAQGGPDHLVAPEA